VKSERKLRSLLKTTKAKVTAKADEVKTIGKALKEFRTEKDKQVDKKIEAESSVTLPPHFATAFNISILTCTSCILIFISISNPFLADPLDQHFRTFTIGDLRDCKSQHLSQRTASVQADTLVKTLANPDSMRPFKIPGTWPGLRYENIPRNPLVPSHLPSGQVRKSETKSYHDPLTFNYLDFPR
jgi:hypothetical protein